jgi:hypothetical protein
MKKIKIMSFIILTLFGVFVFIYGGYDDSPGAQLLGFLFFVGGIFLIYKNYYSK